MSDFNIETFDTREAWLAHRNDTTKPTIGGSDAAVIFGVSGFKSPTTLWAEKTGKVAPEKVEAIQADCGTALEPVIAKWSKVATTHTLVDPGLVMLRSKEREWQHHTPDRIVIWREDAEKIAAEYVVPLLGKWENLPKLGLAEFKSVEASYHGQWEHEPSDYALIQLQHGLSVTGWDGGLIAALIGKNKVRVFEVQRQPALIDAILEAECDFIRCILEDKPPAPDWSESTTKTLRKLYPTDDGTEIILEGEEWAANLQRFREAKAQVSVAMRELDAVKNTFRAAIGNASKAVIPGVGALTHKLIKKAAYQVAAQEYRELRETK